MGECCIPSRVAFMTWMNEQFSGEHSFYSNQRSSPFFQIEVACESGAVWSYVQSFSKCLRYSSKILVRSINWVIVSFLHDDQPAAAKKLEAPTRVLNNVVQHCEHCANDINWLIEQSLRIFIPGKFNALSASQEQWLKTNCNHTVVTILWPSK